MEDTTKKKESHEKKIPVFRVLKKGLMLKNIILLDKTSIIDQDDEQVLLVGRHPDCSIVLEHPSISRFHLRIHLQPSLQKLSVVDLSSAHGTWVSDTKIEPRVPVELSEGDTLRLGVSTRTYTLHWVSFTSVLHAQNPNWAFQTLVPPITATHNPEKQLSPRCSVFHHETSLLLLNSQNPLPSQQILVEKPHLILLEKQMCPSLHVLDADFPSVLPHSQTILVPATTKPENHLPSDEVLSNPENHFPMQESCGALENPNLISSEDPSDCVFQTAQFPASETTLLPEGKEEEGVFDTAYLNSAQQHLTPVFHATGDGKSPVLLNFINQVPPEEIEQGGLVESACPISFDQHLCPLVHASDVEDTKILPIFEKFVLPKMKEGVFDSEHLNSAEQQLSQSTHVSGVENTLVFPNFENQLVAEEIEEDGVLENNNPVSFEQHLYLLGCVFNAENPVDILMSKTLVPPKVSQEGGLSENEVLNSAEQHLSPWSHVCNDENTLGLSNFENDLSPEEIEEVGVLENKNPILFEQRLSLPDNAFDNETMLVLPNFKSDLPPEEMEEVSVLESKNPTLSEQHLSPHGYIFDAKNQLGLQQNLSDTLHSENTPGFLKLESSVLPGEIVEGLLDNQTLVSSDEHYLNPLSCVFNVERPVVSPSSENTLLPDENEVQGVLANENIILCCQHMSPSAAPLLNFTEDILSPSSISGEKVGSESTSSSESPNNFMETVQSVADYQEPPQHRLERESNTPSLWSRRGKPPSLIRIATACSKEKTMEVNRDDENESDNQSKIEDESVNNVSCSSSDAEEETLFSNNENYTREREVGLESVDKGNNGEVELRWSYGSLSSTRSDDKGLSTFSEKENLTPVFSHDSRLRKPLSESRLGKEADMIMSQRMEGRMPFQCLVVNSVENSTSEAHIPVTDMKTSYVNCDQDELTPKVLFACSDGEEEIFTPYKENCIPEAGHGSQSIEKGRSVELELEKKYGLLASSNNAQHMVMTATAKENSTEVAVPVTSTTSCKTAQICDKQSYRNAEKSWYMVVDTNCLLNKDSRRSLQLLQELKGTQLVIPRAVIRELDCQQRGGSLLKMKTEASSVLEWIEECTVKSKFWIHVQSSKEEPIAPTPPTSPRWLSWLIEVSSPIAKDHVLDCALLFKRIKKDDGCVVLLSDDVALKIKAMAEGILCETGREFRESLVNPYSDRFLWVGSIPRGPTWSYLEEPGVRENCYNVPANKIVFKAAEGANKGLKLLLFHNHLNSRQMISVS